jgi:lipopolysaccharide transport system permease protein
MIESIQQLIQYRELLYMITWRDIRIKYKQSIMGFMWALMMPLFVISAGILIKFAISQASGKPMVFSDIVTVTVKSLPWAFFVSSIRFSSTSLISNTNLVTKIYFPKIILPFAAILSQLIDFFVASSLLIVFLSIIGIGASVNLFWIPILISILILFALALGVFLAAGNLFYRDVKYLVDAVLTFAIFFTPVYYETTLFGDWGALLLVNPVASILEALNDCIVYQKSPKIGWVFYSAGASFVLLWLSTIMFRKLEPMFAENV